jgi:squalene synthase HpnC
VVLDAAYAACAKIARDHDENFPVASRLLPRAMRPHIAAIYAFSRIADDFADEGTAPASDRLSRLDDWQRRLHDAAAGRAPAADDYEAVFTALARTMTDCRLEVALFEHLLSAFRQDVTTSRYETWDDLLDYCRRSANPVGRLVLRVSGRCDPALDARSDDVCTALQLTNFWQDLERDWAKGRLYVPGAIVRAHGADPAALDRRTLTPEWRAALEDVAGRTLALFARGRPIADAVTGRLRWELRATWLGGTRILARLSAVEFNVFARRPALGWRDIPGLAWRAATWRRGAAVEPAGVEPAGRTGRSTR